MASVNDRRRQQNFLRRQLDSLVIVTSRSRRIRRPSARSTRSRAATATRAFPHMSELDPDFDAPVCDAPDSAAPAFREGLPASYRMRADSHYVEDLVSDVFAPPIRLLDADTIDGAGDACAPPSDFVESVRRHGVLQPLLVRGRAGRYRLIAGGKRLAA